MAEQQSIQSVDAALRVLQVMAAASRALSLKDLAQAVDMTASNTHRYMVSLVRAGMAVQDSATGRYDLGPFALRLGLAAMRRTDAIAIATRVMGDLRDKLDLALTLTVWTPDGPTMIRWLDSSQPLTVNVKPGSRSPLFTSASGRVFLAYEPAEKTRALVAAELRLRRSRKESKWTALDDVDVLRAEVRRHGLGRVTGDRVAGICSLSAPIFDALGQLVLTISAVGLEHDFDVRYDGAVAQALRAAAAEVSAQLGHKPGA